MAVDVLTPVLKHAVPEVIKRSKEAIVPIVKEHITPLVINMYILSISLTPQQKNESELFA